jgi:hypothetical protein
MIKCMQSLEQCMYALIIEQVALNISDLLLKIILQNPKHYNYLQRLLNQTVCTKIIKMPSGKDWVQRPSGLTKSGRKRKRF